jgi:hypothetical protein
MPINMKLMWNLLENRDLFTSRTHHGSTYSPFLGSHPQTLTMDRAKEARKWMEVVPSLHVEEYYGGPFWDYRTDKPSLPGIDLSL